MIRPSSAERSRISRRSVFIGHAVAAGFAVTVMAGFAVTTMAELGVTVMAGPDPAIHAPQGRP